MTPRMTAEEMTLLREYYSKAKIYFEWGSGGSTVIADSYKNIERIYSVESDQEWIDNVRLHLCYDKTTFYYTDINAGEWGAPKDSSKIANWPNYSSCIAQATDAVDLILVDGRFRVACAAIAYKHLVNGGYLLVHDYSLARSHYHVIEKIYTVVDKANNLAVMQKIEKLEYEAERMYNEYKLKYS